MGDYKVSTRGKVPPHIFATMSAIHAAAIAARLDRDGDNPAAAPSEAGRRIDKRKSSMRGAGVGRVDHKP